MKMKELPSCLPITTNREERRKQKDLLRGLYPDYDPRRHDAFVIRYNKQREKEALERYEKTRGIE